MNLFKRLFAKKEPLISPKDDSLLYKQLCESINQIAIEVFKKYYSQLLDKSATFIVQAVWGIEVNRVPMTSLQIEIHNEIELIFHHVYSKIEPATIEQSLVTVFLIRDLISTKLNYMISESRTYGIARNNIFMSDMKAIGSA